MPSSIRKSLNELPITLDDTYERILQGIPKEKFQHARRLFQCVVAALRPLRVEELAEIFAIEFGQNEVTNLVEGWRPENAEEAVLSACSSLIAIIDNEGSKIVQFSHFSVKEYMTSDRLQTSDSHLCDYYIPLEPAHTVLARACMAVLLQLDEKVDREQVATFPLGEYASEHWVDHVKFENVQSQIQDDLKHLFNPKRPHLRACIWVHNLEVKGHYATHSLSGHSTSKQPPPLPATPLYYAVLCRFTELAKWLITTHAEDVNAKCYDGRTPLHVGSQEGHVNAVHVLLGHGAHVNQQEEYMNWTPLHFASKEGNLKVVQLLLEHKAALNARSKAGNTPVYLATREGHLEVVRLLLSHGADVHIKGEYDQTGFQIATERGHHDVAQLLLEHGARRE
jgi:desulfoferrodoxin (superoxide reductase-like protein)